jgi:hypothetical protein
MEDRLPDITITERYYKRLRDSVEMFGRTYDGTAWWWVLVPILTLGAFFVVWMYVKDSRSIRWYFAVPLGMARATVYGLLTYMFLLPTIQVTHIWLPRTPPMIEKHSRVVVLLDVSDSQATVSDDPKNLMGTDRKTRLQKVVEYLSDDNAAFLKKLIARNPVHVYRFASRLDNVVYSFKEYEVEGDDGVKRKQVRPFTTRRKKDDPSQEEEVKYARWTEQDWANFATYTDFKAWALRGLSDEGRKLVVSGVGAVKGIGTDPGDVNWAMDYLARDPKGDVEGLKLAADDAMLLKGNRDTMQARIDVARAITQETNVPRSVEAALDAEKDNMLQGIVVFSDGRTTAGVTPGEAKDERKLDPSLELLHRKARKEKVPIFVIAVGDDRVTKLKQVRITDLQTPSETPPDDAFKILVEVDGENMPGETVPVQLELLPPDSETPVILEGQVTFDRSEPPHGQAEWTIDPAKLPEKVPDDLKPSVFVNGGLKEGVWKAKVTTPKVNDEGKADPKQRVASEINPIKVSRKNISVLLMCGAPNRDFQFLLNQLLREKSDSGKEAIVGLDKENISVYVQNEAGTFQDGKSISFLENKARHLKQFPNKLRVDDVPNESEEEKWLNLARYDVIIAFDPDWTLLSEEQAQLLRTWVDLQAGGLLHVAGSINTKKMMFENNPEKLAPLLEVFPVSLGDNVLSKPNQDRRFPRRLEFPGAAPEMEFLRLDDDKPDDVLSGWEPFFTGKESREEGAKLEVKRGFYDYYPVKDVKAGATVVARYTEPNASENTFDKKDPPYLVTYKFGQGWCVFLGSSEVWRFRQYKDVYFERFWVKMTRFLASGSRKKQDRRGRILMAKDFSSGDNLRATVQLLGPDLKGIPAKSEPVAVIKPVQLDSYADMPGAKKKDGAPKKDDADPDALSKEQEQYHKQWTLEIGFKAKEDANDPEAGYFQATKRLRAFKRKDGSMIQVDDVRLKQSATQETLVGGAKDFPPGVWRIEVPIPNSREKLSQKFTIRKAPSPELADIRPDFTALAAMASEVDEVVPRLNMNKVDVETVRGRAYTAPNVNGPRLMFKFDSKRDLDIIPDCLITETRRIKNPQTEPEIRKSKVEPRWFEGPEMPPWMTRHLDRLTGESEQTHTIALWMLVCIGLLSAEWLTRKLLKLA